MQHIAMLLAASSVWCLLLFHSAMGEDKNKFIANVVPGGEFPFVVSIQNQSGFGDGKHFCAGSILNKFFILTAAQCLCDPAHPKSKEFVKVTAGRHNIAHFGVPSLVKAFKCHKDFASVSKKHDIAVIQLQHPLEFSRDVSKVILPAFSAPEDKKLTVLGWGAYYTWHAPHLNYPSLLLSVKREVVDCTKYGNKPQTEKICAEDVEKEGDCALGDYGGPAIGWDTGRWVQFGVHSWGPKSCKKIIPTFFASVLDHLEWINATVKELSGGKDYLIM